MGFVRNVVGGITGENQAEAIERGSQAQAAAGQAAIDLQGRQFDQFREDLAPFRQFGVDLLPQVQQAFSGDVGNQILSDPVFKALSEESRRQTLSRQAARGRTFLPETDIALQDALLKTGAGLIGQRQGSLLSALGLGQNAAAMVGSAGLQNAAQQGNLLTQIANAQAAGMTGAAGARTAGIGNLLQLGGGILGMFR